MRQRAANNTSKQKKVKFTIKPSDSSDQLAMLIFYSNKLDTAFIVLFFASFG